MAHTKPLRLIGLAAILVVALMTNPPVTNVPPDIDVEVFAPQADAWITMKRSEVKPGQQFFLKSGIAKQAPGTALHDLYIRVDLVQLAEAYRPIEKNRTSRRPRPEEFVYVIAGDPLEAGFKPLQFLRPGHRFRFQGHIYAIRAGSRPDTMLIEDTGETIDSYPAIGRQSADGKIYWRDDFLGHPRIGAGPHVNVRVEGIDFHLWY